MSGSEETKETTTKVIKKSLSKYAVHDHVVPAKPVNPLEAVDSDNEDYGDNVDTHFLDSEGNVVNKKSSLSKFGPMVVVPVEPDNEDYGDNVDTHYLDSENNKKSSLSKFGPMVVVPVEPDNEDYGDNVDTHYLDDASEKKVIKKSLSKYAVHDVVVTKPVNPLETVDSDNEDYGDNVDTHYLDPSEKKGKNKLSKFGPLVTVPVEPDNEDYGDNVDTHYLEPSN